MQLRTAIKWRQLWMPVKAPKLYNLVRYFSCAFAVLSQTTDRAATLRRVATQIEEITEQRLQSNVAASAAILAGLVLEKGMIQQILRREIMQESVIYQEIKAEGIQEGLQQGKEEGLQQGKEEGLQQGKEEGERSLILRQLSRRLGQMPTGVQGQIVQLSLAQLEDLGEALLDFKQMADLETWLENS